MYSFKESMHPQDQHCFRKPLKEWELATTTDMKKWLHTHTIHIKQCLKLDQQRLKTHTHDIRKWMTPKLTNNSIQDNATTSYPSKGHKNTQTTLLTFFSTAQRSQKPRRHISSTQNNKATNVQPTKMTHTTSFIQTMLKLRRKPQCNSQALNHTQSPQPKILAHSRPSSLIHDNVQPLPSNRQVNNNTGTLLSKFTKKFERLKLPKIKPPQTILPRNSKNVNLQHTKNT